MQPPQQGLLLCLLLWHGAAQAGAGTDGERGARQAPLDKHEARAQRPKQDWWRNGAAEINAAVQGGERLVLTAQPWVTPRVGIDLHDHGRDWSASREHRPDGASKPGAGDQDCVQPSVRPLTDGLREAGIVAKVVEQLRDHVRRPCARRAENPSACRTRPTVGGSGRIRANRARAASLLVAAGKADRRYQR